jgi:hypothetical protein
MEPWAALTHSPAKVGSTARARICEEDDQGWLWAERALAGQLCVAAPTAQRQPLGYMCQSNAQPRRDALWNGDEAAPVMHAPAWRAHAASQVRHSATTAINRVLMCVPVTRARAKC